MQKYKVHSTKGQVEISDTAFCFGQGSKFKKKNDIAFWDRNVISAICIRLSDAGMVAPIIVFNSAIWSFK